MEYKRLKIHNIAISAIKLQIAIVVVWMVHMYIIYTFTYLRHTLYQLHEIQSRFISSLCVLNPHQIFSLYNLVCQPMHVIRIECHSLDLRMSLSPSTQCDIAFSLETIIFWELCARLLWNKEHDSDMHQLCIWTNR